MSASFQPLPDFDPNKMMFSVIVPKHQVIPSLLPTSKTTTFASFAGNFQAAWTLTSEFGDYVYLFSRATSGGLEFVFGKTRTGGELTTAVRSTVSWETGVYWPPVFLSMASPATAFLAYDSDGVEYTADINWDFNIRDAFTGPTKLLTEYFVSHTNHTIADLTPMRPNGGTFYYGIGRVELPVCLHSTIYLEYTTGTASNLYPLQTFSKTFATTNYTDWPSTIVIADGERYDESTGLFIRQKVTAYRPSIS